MRLLTKLLKLRAAIEAVIEELDDEASEVEETEILLTRSAKNRRSDKNEVMTMTPLNGAPAVPESWKGRGSPRAGAGEKNRQVLAKILADCEPMTRPEVWNAAREIDPRLEEGMAQKSFQQMVNRMLKLGKVQLKRGKLVMGA